jgi:lysophospholipase L1-like esterase
MTRLPAPLAWIGPRVIAFAAALVALELGLYHLGDYGKWVVQERSARYGWRMLPHQDGWSRDYDVPERINAWGYRDDRDWAPPLTDEEGRARHDPGLLRVAVVGNSMTYGTSVPVESTWPQVLERELEAELERRGDPRDVLVMNFAVQGYTFEQMARIYDDRIRAWRPDVLVWPALPPDIRPMHPEQDDADYRFRRQVIRTATYDMLRHHVIHKWIPQAGASDVEPPTDVAKQDFVDAIEAPVREAFLEVYGPQRGPAELDARWPAALAALEGAEPHRAFGRFQRTLTQDMPESRDGRDPVLAVWSAIESNLTQPVWQLLDDHFKARPFSPENAFLWHLRGRRMDRILDDLERDGGRLFVIGLPSLPRLVLSAESPMVYWGQTWAPAARAAGKRPITRDLLEPFVEPMSELVAEIHRRGYVQGDAREELAPDYRGLERSLVLLKDPTHYNAAGHELLGRVVAQQMVVTGLIEGRGEPSGER